MYQNLEYTLNLISSLKSPELVHDTIQLLGPNRSGGSIFNSMTFRIELKSKKDIPVIIVSNRDVNKRKFLERMDIVSAIIPPLALVNPQVVFFDALFLVEGLIEVGVAIDDLIDDKNIGQKRLFFGLLNAISAFPGLLGPKELKSFYTRVRNLLLRR
jgi:hypothetical protein